MRHSFLLQFIYNSATCLHERLKEDVFNSLFEQLRLNGFLISWNGEVFTINNSLCSKHYLLKEKHNLKQRVTKIGSVVVYNFRINTNIKHNCIVTIVDATRLVLKIRKNRKSVLTLRFSICMQSIDVYQLK